MINFYGKLSKIMIIVLTTASKFLLIKQNATWKASAQNGQKRPKAKTRKTIKKCKNDKDDDTSASSKDNNTTSTSRASSKNNKNAPPEVQQHSFSLKSDSSGKQDDVSSNDELELLESPNKKHQNVPV